MDDEQGACQNAGALLSFLVKRMPILSQEQVDMIEQLYQSITISRQ